jgi:hypothetical protein
MWRLLMKVIISVFLLSINESILAATAACTVNTKNIASFNFPTISSSDRITAGLSGEQNTYREIYTWNAYRSATGTIVCTASSSRSLSFYQYIISPYGSPVKHGAVWIFPTNTAGIGISFSENGHEIGNAINPYVEITSSGTSVSFNRYFRTKVTLWKTPGVTGNADSDGNLNFEGFKITGVVRPTNYPTDTISNIPTSDISNDFPGSVTENTTTFSGKITFVPGTCNFTNKTVEMGLHQRTDLTNNSPWVNASFTINCPEAWGYGRTATMSGTTANTISNRSANTATQGIIVTVIPRNGTIDGTRGIIGLKPGGAEGLGIQLAWGEPATLPTTGDPATAARVIFDQSQVVSNEDFGTSGNTYTREIKMAARYIRTGTIQPGRADSSIEIVASYN